MGKSEVEAKTKKSKIVLKFKSFIWKLTEVILQHPFTYAKVLIQVGYEPFPPTLRKFFGLKCLALPNMFCYVDYIEAVDGKLGCFRGLLPHVCCVGVNIVVTRLMMRTYYDNIFSPPPRRKKSLKFQKAICAPPASKIEQVKVGQLKLKKEYQPEGASIILKKTALKLICMAYGVFASHPFYVIMVRTMGEFVGREQKYTSMKASAIEIYKNHGSAGVLARLLAEYINVLIPTAVILLLSKLRKRRSWITEQILDHLAFVLASWFSNKLYVVSNNRAINNSGLMVGYPPYTHLYKNSIECWRGLSNSNQLNRGCFKWWRAYKGPTVLIGDQLTPDGFFFGPIHRPNLGILL